ncbi:hypothetical protein BC835DRAFT_1424018 [Cytidiella melzeri]|nr:hypothetical protein BC835DRAFT_1424018 [Cytidiella melzeri]
MTGAKVEEIPTRELVITEKTTRKNLQDELKQYNLHFSGNRSALLGRLQAFAENRDEWFSAYQSRMKRRQGYVTGTRAASSTEKRILDMFGNKNAPRTHLPKKGNQLRPVCPLSESHIKYIDEWAADLIRAVHGGSLNTNSASQPVPAEKDDAQYQTARRPGSSPPFARPASS